MPVVEMTPNAAIMPVTVPSSPSSGESVMIVSSTGSARRIRASSSRAAASMASVGRPVTLVEARSEHARLRRRATPRASSMASSHLPAAAKLEHATPPPRPSGRATRTSRDRG